MDVQHDDGAPAGPLTPANTTGLHIALYSWLSSYTGCVLAVRHPAPIMTSHTGGLEVWLGFVLDHLVLGNRLEEAECCGLRRRSGPSGTVDDIEHK